MQLIQRIRQCVVGKPFLDLIKKGIPYLWILGTFGLLDVWLRIETRWIGLYSIFEIAPNAFTLLWAVILTVLVTLPKSRKAGRILYGVTYYVFMIYSLIQYGAYLCLGKFLYFSDFLNTGEGTQYASWILSFVTVRLLLEIVVLLTVGLIGILLFPHQSKDNSKVAVGLRLGLLCVSLIGVLLTPKLYGSPTGEWNDFSNPAFEYTKFVEPNYDMELTGMYQFMVKDLKNQTWRLFKLHNRDVTPIDAFFAEREPHQNNEMTGVFRDKNVILVMMESIDDWMITEQDMPTLYRMMKEGITFANFYTPGYANGYTFNTEFAFNTGVYPYSNGNVTYALANSTFSSGVASVFHRSGYATHSYHKGTPSFYNRGIMHRAFGYEQYHSFEDYPQIGLVLRNDCFLVEHENVYRDLVGPERFCSFVITYSPHLPYDDTEWLSQLALERYPQYDVAEQREVNILRAKAKMTDDMFAGLLTRLEEDGLLQDTVIVGFADHYAYGLSDKELLQQLSEAAGSSILEKSPAFVYCADWETPMVVDKVMQTTDLGPTLLNLFGLEVPHNVMGCDVFDEAYEGYVIFPHNTWVTKDAYVKNGVVQWNTGMSDGEIAEMNAFVQRVYAINDAILDTDYYAQKADKDNKGETE